MKLSGMAAGLSALASCTSDQPTANPDSPSPTTPPTQYAWPIASMASLTLHTLRRFTFGPSAAELAQATEEGLEAWFEEQLTRVQLEDDAVRSRLEDIETLEMTPEELYELDDPGQVARELIASTIIHQVFSPHQVHEVMVDFWTNHFNIYALEPPQLFLKHADDGAIREHALGRFPDLLEASAHSPAMLVYLDNAQSQTPQPNENYGRELLELHSLGVDGGYTHDDVYAAARAFTGWSVVGLRDRQPDVGAFVYRPEWHDDGPKVFLGQPLPGGKADGDQILQIVAEHPSTARYISWKLCQRFIQTNPPESIVEACAQAYLENDGDIPSMLRTIVFSDEFAASAGMKFKRPLDFLVSAIRTTGADGDLTRILQYFLRALGQEPHSWPTPDGFPDDAGSWNNTNQMLNRWSFALSLAFGEGFSLGADLTDMGQDSASLETLVENVSQHLLGEALPREAGQIIVDLLERLEPALQSNDIPRTLIVTAMILASPFFQVR